MASGYTTSDGKDLDQRYLAINGKAASAVVADKANSLSTTLGHKGANPITMSLSGNASYTITTDCCGKVSAVYSSESDVKHVEWSIRLKATGRSDAYTDGKYNSNVGGSKGGSVNMVGFFKKGDVVSATFTTDALPSYIKKRALEGTLYPITHY